jgi:hypothetical protein
MKEIKEYKESIVNVPIPISISENEEIFGGYADVPWNNKGKDI